MFIPENTSSERSTVHSYLQSVSGVSRTVGWFGSADGRIIVTSVEKSPNSNFCHFGVPGAPGDAQQYGYATANACPGGTTDRFGSVYGNSLESLSESQDNPYYNTAASSNTATNFYLSYRYTNSRNGSENVWDYNISWCTDPTFPWRQYQIRQCYISADRGRCWDQCGNNIPSVVETLVVAGGGGGGSSFNQYWAGGEQCFYDEELGIVCEYVSPYSYINTGGGGGAGGVRSANTFIEVNTTYTVTVGSGGAGGGYNGSSSIFSTTATQGGGGGGYGTQAGFNGGSGGGGGAYYNNGTWTTSNGGTGNTSPLQGSNGGNGGSNNHGGGGGGASEAGNTDGQGEGGDGSSSSISGSAVTRAGGGAGSRLTTPGTNNGGDGGGGSSTYDTNGTNGTANLGAGGGGAGVPAQSMERLKRNLVVVVVLV